MANERLPKFWIATVTDDGPSRIEGMKGYQTFGEAVRAAEDWARSHSGWTIAVVETAGHFWLDPLPRVLNDMPKVKAPNAP